MLFCSEPQEPRTGTKKHVVVTPRWTTGPSRNQHKNSWCNHVGSVWGRGKGLHTTGWCGARKGKLVASAVPVAPYAPVERLFCPVEVSFQLKKLLSQLSIRFQERIFRRSSHFSIQKIVCFGGLRPLRPRLEPKITLCPGNRKRPGRYCPTACHFRNREWTNFSINNLKNGCFSWAMSLNGSYRWHI